MIADFVCVCNDNERGQILKRYNETFLVLVHPARRLQKQLLLQENVVDTNIEE